MLNSYDEPDELRDYLEERFEAVRHVYEGEPWYRDYYPMRVCVDQLLGLLEERNQDAAEDG